MFRHAPRAAAPGAGGLVLAAALLAAGPAWAQESPAAAPDCVPRIELSPDGEDLSARYRLCAAAPEFVFGEVNAVQRQASWSAGDDWSFDGQTLRRADDGAFDGFTLTLAMDDRFYDRRYVAIDRVGEGWSVLTSALTPDGGDAELRFSGFAGGAVVHAEGQSLPAETAVLPLPAGRQHVLYVGPAEAVVPGAITVIAGDEIPAWLRARLVESGNMAVERFSARFGARPGTDPTLIVSSRTDPYGSGMKGGVLDGDVVEIRIRGIDLDTADDGLAAQMDGNITHEAAHFWLGHLWPAARNWQEPWLHEGAAEYVASRLLQDADSLEQESERRLNACLLRADERPLDGSQDPVAGSAPYDCGFVVMLAAEAASLAQGRGDIFDLWRAVADQSGPDGFLPATFLAEATERGGAPFAAISEALLGAPSAVDRAALAAAFQGLGVAAEARRAGEADADMLRGGLLMPVLAGLCTGGRGFTTLDDRLVLDTGERCGAALAGDPVVVAVNGVNLMTDAPEAYEAVRAVCAEGGDLRFSGTDGAELAPVPCAAEIPPLPELLAISRLPDLPQP